MLENLLEKRRWTADAVVFRQEHPVANAISIVQDTSMAQTSGFGHAGCSRGKLDVDNVVGV